MKKTQTPKARTAAARDRLLANYRKIGPASIQAALCCTGLSRNKSAKKKSSH
jgi:hypothetical protein